MKLKQTKKHKLLGSSITFTWLSRNYETYSIGATVSEWYLSYSGEEKLFELILDPDSRKFYDTLNGQLGNLAETHLLDEASLLNLITASQGLPKLLLESKSELIYEPVPSHPTWIVPDMFYIENGGALAMISGVATLRFFVDDSLIPGAGKGLFVRHTYGRSNFVLPRGVLLDIGIYSPREKGEIKNEALMNMKNYILDAEPQSWSFDHAGDEEIVYDITDEWDGDLSQSAKSNMLVYANETDGVATATLHARSDIRHGVHYLLGHDFPAGSDFILRKGETVELKVDYGAMYEEVRVRKGYPRVKGKELKLLQSKVDSALDNYLEDVSHWSVDKVSNCIGYAEMLLEKPMKCIPFRAKFLVFSVALIVRLRDIVKEMSEVNVLDQDSFNDNGYTTMDEDDLIPRLHDVLNGTSELWDSFDSMLGEVSSNHKFKRFMEDALGEHLKTFNGLSFKAALTTIITRKRARSDPPQLVREGIPTEPIPGGWPEGWVRRDFQRQGGETVGRVDKYWYPPGHEHHRLRSMKEVERYMAALKDSPGKYDFAWSQRKG